MNINFVYAKFPWILPKWLSCVCISLLLCKLRTIGVFRILGNNDFIIIYTSTKYTYFIFSLTFSFFILLNVSFVNKSSFMFPLALLIGICLSFFWYSWIVYFLCIYILFRYLSNPFTRAFRSKFRLWFFYNFLLSKVLFNLYSSLALITSNLEISCSSIISLLIMYDAPKPRGPVDQPSTYGNTILGSRIPKL